MLDMLYLAVVIFFHISKVSTPPDYPTRGILGTCVSLWRLPSPTPVAQYTLTLYLVINFHRIQCQYVLWSWVPPKERGDT